MTATAPLFFVSLSKQQRAALVAAARERIAKAEAKRREAKRERDAARAERLAKARKRNQT